MIKIRSCISSQESSQSYHLLISMFPVQLASHPTARNIVLKSSVGPNVKEPMGREIHVYSVTAHGANTSPALPLRECLPGPLHPL